MKLRLNRSVAVGGAALILFSGCVSSRKYKTSQAELAKVRADSAQLAQQVTTENGNIHDLQDKNSSLQKSLDASNANAAAQQKSVDNYRSYFKDQQDTLAAVNQDVQGALTQAGITNGDVQQADNAIYVRLDEKDLFKKNSTMITPVGQKVLDNIAQLVKNRENMHVGVASDDSAVAWTSTSTDNMSAGSSMSAAPVHHRVHHASHASAPASGNNGTAATPAVASTAGQTTTTPAPKKVHHHYSPEGSTAMMSGTHGTHAWALKQGRMVKVADRFLQCGVPKINLSLQRPPMNGTPQNTAIKIIITPKMKSLNPQNSSAMAGTE